MKTRLLPALLPEQAAEVHRACLEDTVRLAGCVPACRKWLLVAASLTQVRQLAASLGLDASWRVGVQRGRDLGARMERAIETCFRCGYRRVVVVGTDTPWMGSARIRQAIHLLDSADVVLGPSADGGYYLVGARRIVQQMFRNIPWGKSRVLEMTRRALERARVGYRLLPRDFDLDRPEDLERAAELLRRDASRAPALARRLSATHPAEVMQSEAERLFTRKDSSFRQFG